ncbi:sigma-70 family RNA polymerase sigma factor [Amaricoccus sp. W119]|uniref:sigma-70 family RNA polymerase sigma factor n=1 Tax=Amaricoccus sp. W119 TaxID=3391833 RepID=UPI0039A430E2
MNMCARIADRRAGPEPRGGHGIGRGVWRETDGAKESSELSDLSEQTGWMIAVRDRGDRAAFARLFAFYAPRVKAMALRSGMPDPVAEDIAQDVMLRVWQARAGFDPSRASASAWIYQIARNRRVDVVRGDRTPVPEPLAAVPGPDETADALALAQEIARLRSALDTLPARQREMIERAYLGEMSTREISRLTSLPLGTVKSRLRLAIDRLRHELRSLRR